MSYWDDRALADEAKAQKNAAKAAERQAKLFKSAYKSIEQQLNDLALYLMNKEKYGKISRSELWKIKKYIDLQNTIAQTFDSLAGQQITIFTDALRQIFEESLDATLEDFNSDSGVAYTIYNDAQISQLLNSAWSGKNYSQRIYDTTSVISERVKKDMTDMIVMGKNTDLIKKKVMRDFDVSYSYADRLIRTEASQIYNTAALAGYKQAGVEQVKVLVESNACDACAEFRDKVFKLIEAPHIPQHPNCRCCYAPIVDLDAKKQQAEAKTKDLQSSSKPLVFFKHSDRHQKHAEKATGLSGEEAWILYQEQAGEFLKRDVGGSVDAFVSPDGWMFKFDVKTKEFGLLSNKGTISTYYTENIYNENPDDYWDEQLKKYKRREK